MSVFIVCFIVLKWLLKCVLLVRIKIYIYILYLCLLVHYHVIFKFRFVRIVLLIIIDLIVIMFETEALGFRMSRRPHFCRGIRICG